MITRHPASLSGGTAAGLTFGCLFAAAFRGIFSPDEGKRIVKNAEKPSIIIIMDDEEGKKETRGSPSAPAVHELPLDTKLLSDAVIELNISRKNVGIYPPGHIQITKSIDRAYEILLRMFEVRPEMTLGVAKDTLLVGQDYLDQKNPVYRDFALSLNQQGIAAVTFVQGLGKEELVRFHRILTTKPEEIRAAGGTGKVMSDADIPHIRIQVIDYGNFQVTEEQEIIRTHARRGDEKPGIGVWQDFVSHLVAGTLAAPGQGVSLKDASDINPAELARLLNERKLDAGAAIQSYDRIISDHVRTRAEKKQPTTDQSAALAKLNSLVKNLHPELRRQFLSSAFQHVSSPASAAGAEELLGDLPETMVIEMLSQASEEGRQISPTLAGLIQKMSRIGDTVHQGPRPERTGTVQDRQAPAISPEHLEKLFDRESYEQYVTTDYDATLKHLTEHITPAGVTTAEGFSPAEYTESLNDDLLDFQIGRALLAFMEEEIEADDYREFCGKLVTVVPGLLDSGNFALLLDVLETLRRQGREKAHPDVRALAEESLKIFVDPEFTAKAVIEFDRWARTKGREAAGFLLALGPQTVPKLLDIYAEDESPGGRRILFDLLCNFGKAAISEAQKRLRDPRPYYVRNLVMLIRWAGSQAAVPHIKPLLRHPDPKVRMEAVAALLRFKDTEAVPLLREALRSKDPDIASQAVFIAGQYRVAVVTVDLVSMVKKVILFDTDYTVNEEIIRALGEIGDPTAVPELERLARASWTLYPERLSRMKVALFESLSRYPKESIAGLLKAGERLNDDRIKRACRKFRERK